jgi:signal peptidase I
VATVRVSYSKEIILISRLLGLNLSEPMHLRKRTTIVLVMFALILFVIGSIASLITVADTTQQREGYYYSDSLQPSSEISKTVRATQPESMLSIELNSTDRIITTIALNGETEFLKNESHLEHTFLLRKTGLWNVTFRNENAELVTYTYGIALTTFYPITTYPVAGIIFPTFATAEFLLCMLLPVNFLDNMKRMSKKTRETLLFCIIAFLALGFMPLLSLLTGTTTPLFSPISSSMEPTVPPGDLALVTHVYPRSLQIGDIIVYDKLMETLQSTPTQISAPTLHRIARIVVANNQRFFVTKGDNNPNEDTWFVPEEGIVGKVALVIPLLGNVVLLLSLIEVKIGVIVATFVVIALWPNKKAKTEPEMKNHERVANH